MLNRQTTKAQISNDLDVFGSTIKERVRLARQKEKDRTNKPFFRCLSLFFRNWHLLGKRTFTTADIHEFEADMQVEHVYRRLSAAIATSIGDSRQLGEQSASVFKLYDTIIKKTIGNGKRWAVVKDLLIYLMNGGAFFTLFLVMNLIPTDTPVFPKTFTYAFAILVIMTISRLLDHSLSLSQFKSSIKTKMGILVLAYYKLISSDISFLEQADSAFIYKAFYFYLEEYANHTMSFMPIILILTSSILWSVLSRALGFGYSGDYYIYGGLLVCGSLVVTSIFRSKLVWRHRSLLVEERKVIFEWLHHFKFARSANLKTRFASSLKSIRESKVKLLAAIANYHTVLLLLWSHGDVAVPVLLILVALIRDWQVLSSGGRLGEDHVLASYLTKAHLTIFMCSHHYYLTRMLKVMVQIEYYLRKTFASKFYDRLFGANTYISRSLVEDPAMGIGELQFQDCEVLIREEISGHRGGSTLILQSKESENTQAGQEAERDSTREHGQSSEHSQDPIYFKVIQGLNLKVATGERVCVVPGKNKVAVEGFFKAIIGEAVVSRGSLRSKGKISYFNRDVMPFLVGKTVRDNIIFGEKYINNRYEQVLRVVRARFDHYNGGDFYQIGEKGANMKSDDRFKILLARFLYRDTDIYVAEDLFLDSNVSLVQYLAPGIFLEFLQTKTVIFAAKDPRLVAIASQRVRFSGKLVVKVSRHIPKTTAIEEKAEAQLYTSNGTIRNAIFIQHVSFEEELVVRKKLNSQKKAVEQKLMAATNIFEKIAYGIYLTNKRRQEGTNIKEHPMVKLKDIVDYFKGREKPGVSKTASYSVLLVNVAVAGLSYAQEHLLFNLIFDTSTSKVSISLTVALLVVCLYAGRLLLAVGEAVLSKKLYVQRIGLINERIATRILESDYSKLSGMHHHDVLSTLNDSLASLEVRVSELMRSMIQHLAFILVGFVVILWLYSFMFPLILIGLFIGVISFCIWRLTPAYLSSISVLAFSRAKKDEFYFHLLPLVLGHRIAGSLRNVNSKFLKITDNFTRSLQLTTIEFKVLYAKIINFTTIVFIVLSLTMILTILKNDSMNWFKVPAPYLLWGIPIIYRILLRVDIFFVTLLDLMGELVNIYKLLTFIDQGDKKIVKYQFRYSPPPPDFSKPLVFKNVSLTLGYKPVLKKINFKVKAMQRVGVLGFEGCGRSSLFDLIVGARQRDHRDSEIDVFGISIEFLVDEKVRNQVYLIGKEPVLLEGTVRENLDPYGKFKEELLLSILIELGIERVMRREVAKNHTRLKDEDLKAMRHLGVPHAATIELASLPDQKNFFPPMIKVRQSSGIHHKRVFPMKRTTPKPDGDAGKNTGVFQKLLRSVATQVLKASNKTSPSLKVPSCHAGRQQTRRGVDPQA